MNTSMFKQTFNFRTVKATDQDKLADLQAVIANSQFEGDTLEQVKDETGAVVGFKRKAIVATLSTLPMAELLANSGLSAKQVETMQDILNGFLETTNKSKVDEGSIEFIPVLQALEQGLPKREASVKITLEQVKATIAVLLEFIGEEIPKAGRDLLAKMCEKKFSLTVTAGHKDKLLEGFKSIIETFESSLEGAEKLEHQDVIELWKSNIDKVLNKEELDTSDLLGAFAL